jgi:hypothetical protein
VSIRTSPLLCIHDIPLSTDQALCFASSALRVPALGSGTPLVCVASSTVMVVRDTGQNKVGSCVSIRVNVFA